MLRGNGDIDRYISDLSGPDALRQCRSMLGNKLISEISLTDREPTSLKLPRLICLDIIRNQQEDIAVSFPV
jgi:hypothetical protein